MAEFVKGSNRPTANRITQKGVSFSPASRLAKAAHRILRGVVLLLLFLLH